MKEDKVTYFQIESANKEIKTMKLGSKEYAPVNERIKAFRKVFPTGTIDTFIEEKTEDSITIRATIYDEQRHTLAMGRASERKSEKGINAFKLIENCETSAIGRALGIAGFGVDGSIASAEDMENNEATKTFEIAKGISISMKEAVNQAKLTINELYKKMGMRVQELDDFLVRKVWTHLQDMNIWQLLKLESELKKANMETSEWHELYNTNTKAKDVVPKNQEVVYKSTWRRFGEMALAMCGSDENKKQQVIEEYMEQEIDLGTTY